MQDDVWKTKAGSSHMFGTMKRRLRPIYQKLVKALPDEWHVKLDYLKFHRCLPNLSDPRTFNEKIAWRKLFDRDPRLPLLMDKVLVKEFIGEQHGYELITPTLAVYESTKEMDFAGWPLVSAPYVVKASHGSGMNLFVRDVPVDHFAISKTLDAWLKVDYSRACGEWAYSQIKPRILVEPLLGGGASVTDYKLHVFSGSVFAIEVILDRFGAYRINFYNPDWQLLGIQRYAERPRCESPVQRPRRLPDMIKLAESIGRDFAYVRVDLYEIEEQVKFGELTFYTGAANDRFDPPLWDERFGEQMDLGRFKVPLTPKETLSKVAVSS